jgi:hypothetical protein
MALVQPTKARATVTEDALRMTLSIPSQKNWFVIVFLGFWLCGWLAGEIMVPLTFFDKESLGPEALFTVAWLAMWTVGGAFAIYTFAWSVAGKEIVSIDQSRLSVKRDVLGFGRLKEYALDHVANIRVASAPANMFDFKSAHQFWGTGGGQIAFDYGSGTIRLGSGVEEGEANSIVARLKERARKAGYAAV